MNILQAREWKTNNLQMQPMFTGRNSESYPHFHQPVLKSSKQHHSDEAKKASKPEDPTVQVDHMTNPCSHKYAVK